jgi:hypothetical protein
MSSLKSDFDSLNREESSKAIRGGGTPSMLHYFIKDELERITPVTQSIL